ncbi:hypothetical protein EVAR_31038_1 [Eumeta japonica]|uniref:Uncharacterized protein n=1 Tax=Eumeta variegata TaxID=151549 RepID=A0A4C1VER2_EUMVA|nr:hypothetical protein EVAR_31038_1 [Eumeta japonica]
MCETHWYNRPPRSTDAECGRRCAPTTLRTTRCLPGHRGNDFKLKSNALGCSLPTGRSAARLVRSTRSGSPMRVALTCGRRFIDVRRAAVASVRDLSRMERIAARDASRSWAAGDVRSRGLLLPPSLVDYHSSCRVPTMTRARSQISERRAQRDPPHSPQLTLQLQQLHRLNPEKAPDGARSHQPRMHVGAHTTPNGSL